MCVKLSKQHYVNLSHWFLQTDFQVTLQRLKPRPKELFVQTYSAYPPVISSTFSPLYFVLHLVLLSPHFSANICCCFCIPFYAISFHFAILPGFLKCICYKLMFCLIIKSKELPLDLTQYYQNTGDYPTQCRVCVKIYHHICSQYNIM